MQRNTNNAASRYATADLSQWDERTVLVFRKLLGWRHEKAGTMPESVKPEHYEAAGREARKVLTNGWLGCIPWSDGRSGYDSLDADCFELRMIWRTFCG